MDQVLSAAPDQNSPFLIPAGSTRLPDGRFMRTEEYERRLELLSKVFDQDEVEKLPKQLRKDDRDYDYCRQGTRVSADGHYCGGRHARALHLDYIGHAGITDRLNQVDPLWTWEPMGYTPQGTPLMTDGGMWGKLTVLGVTRIGFGDAQGKTGPNAVKEIIGDFLRNASMRFGVGTYLWGKSESALAKKRGEEPDNDDESRHQTTMGAVRSQTADQPAAIDWEAQYKATGGDKTKLEALRHMAKNSGAPDDFWLFGWIEKALTAAATNEPIEGKLV